MRPVKLVLENIGPFPGKTSIDFTALDDVFLITGRTGSGKTTIFDAICFALYGSLPGNRSNHVNRIKSDYAAKDDESSVSLEFSLGKKQYRIDRSPKQEKQKKRGSGFSEYDETAVLYELQDNRYICISSKKSEADSKIIELLGLSKDEFFKIVLLPQGEFAEFLKQNTTHRREVLQKLFPVDRAVAIREYIQDKARVLTAQKNEIERSLEELSKRFSIESYDDMQKKARNEAAECRKKIKSISEKQSVLGNALQIAESLREQTARLDDTKNEASHLENQRDEIYQKEEALKKSREAQPLMRYIVLYNENSQTLQKTEAALEQCIKKEKEALKNLEFFTGNINFEKDHEDRLIKLREQKTPLAELVKDEQILNSNLEELQRQRLKHVTITENQKRVEQILSDLENELQTLLSHTRDSDKYEAEWEQRRIIKEWLVAAKKIADQAAVTAGEIKDLNEGLIKNKNEQTALENKIPILKDEIRLLETEKDQTEKGNLAALLALDLKPGIPCPVCGSPEHPVPAPAAAPKFGMDERIETQKHSLEEAEKRTVAYKSEFHSFEQQLNKAEKTYSNFKTELLSIPGKEAEPFIRSFLSGEQDIPSLERITLELGNQVRELNSINDFRTTVRNAQTKIPVLFKDKENKQSELSGFQKEQSIIQEQIRQLESSIKSQKEKHDQVLQEWNTDSLSAALQVLEQRISETAESLNQFRKNREDARNIYTAVTAERELSEKQKLEYQQKYQESRNQLDGVIENSSFKDLEELQNSFLSREDEKLFQDDMDQWKDRVSKNKLLQNELLKNLETLEQQKKETGVAEDTDGIHRIMDELAVRQNEAELAYETAISNLAALEKDADLMKETTQKHEAISRETRTLNELSDDLTGKNPKRTGFDSWLLGLYLKEVAAYASRRLERMSESRYSLLLDTEGDSARGRAGLDLAVFDAYTGKTRPCTTLSGGESFMASICLALGLADSIQNRSGGIRLDAVFIDEGFGSLDEASLDKALIILDELREHRMVGLISHVGEMRTRIPSQIEVLKTGTGSSISIKKGFED